MILKLVMVSENLASCYAYVKVNPAPRYIIIWVSLTTQGTLTTDNLSTIIQTLQVVEI